MLPVLTLIAKPPKLAQYPYSAMTWRSVEYVSGRTFFFSVQASQDVSIYLGETFGAADFTIELGHGGHNNIWKRSERIYYVSNEVFICEAWFSVIFLTSYKQNAFQLKNFFPLNKI